MGMCCPNYFYSSEFLWTFCLLLGLFIIGNCCVAGNSPHLLSVCGKNKSQGELSRIPCSQDTNLWLKLCLSKAVDWDRNQWLRGRGTREELHLEGPNGTGGKIRVLSAAWLQCEAWRHVLSALPYGSECDFTCDVGDLDSSCSCLCQNLTFQSFTLCLCELPLSF